MCVCVCWLLLCVLFVCFHVVVFLFVFCLIVLFQRTMLCCAAFSCLACCSNPENTTNEDTHIKPTTNNTNTNQQHTQTPNNNKQHTTQCNTHVLVCKILQERCRTVCFQGFGCCCVCCVCVSNWNASLCSLLNPAPSAIRTWYPRHYSRLSLGFSWAGIVARRPVHAFTCTGWVIVMGFHSGDLAFWNYSLVSKL